MWVFFFLVVFVISIIIDTERNTAQYNERQEEVKNLKDPERVAFHLRI